MSSEQARGVESATQILAGSHALTVMTGAQVSGVPRARHETTTVSTSPPRVFTLHEYLTDPLVRIDAWRARRRHYAWSARPTPSHEALVEWENAGRLTSIMTHNIDGLHQLAGSSEELVIEVNGSLYEVECLSCGARTAMSDTLERLNAGEEDPACLRCGGILKAGTISLGQPMDSAFRAAVREKVEASDAIALLGVQKPLAPLTKLVTRAAASGTPVLVFGNSTSECEKAAQAVLSGPVDDTFPEIVTSILQSHHRKPVASH